MTVRVYLERKGNVCLSIQSSLCSCQELWAAAIFICWRLLTKRVAHDHCKGKSQLVEPTSFTHAHWRGRVPCAAKKREGLLKPQTDFTKREMASKSLTALPSVVSVAAEKTVIALRCHTRGFEKVFWPIMSIILTSLALVCFAVAAGTPMWVQVSNLHCVCHNCWNPFVVDQSEWHNKHCWSWQRIHCLWNLQRLTFDWIKASGYHRQWSSFILCLWVTDTHM